MPTSFSRQTGVRQNLGTQALNNQVVEVSTFDGMLNAVSLAISRGTQPNALAFRGGLEIRIVKPLKFRKTIILPFPQCAGICVTAVGQVPISAGPGVNLLFDNRSDNVTFRDLFITNANNFLLTIGVGTRVDSCFFNSPNVAGSTFVAAGGLTAANFMAVTRNQVFLNNAAAVGVLADVNGVISDNQFQNGIAVLGNAASSFNAIMGNPLNGASINMGAGLGLNTIIGNTLNGGIIPGPGDIFAGLNT